MILTFQLQLTSRLSEVLRSETEQNLEKSRAEGFLG